MKFRTQLFALAALVALPMSSCVYRTVFAPASPAPGMKVAWPGVAFSEVRAYCYDYTAEEQVSFFINGRMHKGVMNPQGVKLNDAQTKMLLTAITVSRPKQDRTPCYKPHHAFVFYQKDGKDKGDGKVVAVFEMCFGCNRWVETPDGAPEYIDKAALWSLCQELGLPTGVGNKFYTDACNTGRAARL